MRIWLFIGGLNGALSVALGAIGAHALGPAISDATRAMFETAVRYHLIHSLALLAVAALLTQWQSTNSRRAIHAAGSAFTAGIILFCGGLYALSGLDIAVGARLAPFGGTLLILGWLMLAVAALMGRSRQK